MQPYHTQGRGRPERGNKDRHVSIREPVWKGEHVRRTVLLLTTMVVALLMAGGVAMAAAVSGTQGNDTLRGTAQADQIYGLNGNDTLYGFAGNDELYGGAGNDNLYGITGGDEIYGGSGIDNLFGGDNSDFINAADRGNPDLVDCGRSDGVADRIVLDAADRTSNCTNQDVGTRAVQ